ncbi:hypothetical protein B0A55_07707 [Friedmanniomyces simplex]|uniref:N-acetyltransferase domain-containing protein n=1 Tax=Friedmanniomyces simplex TaxID=329884 RepID=A0A4U0X4S9_9PEZI|nr:hypothetical protein B0A55_07707 [Friedmanniomyces simplex]
MPFSILHLQQEDIPPSLEIYFLAFQNPHSLACWPRHLPTVREWWENMFRSELHEPGAQWLKAVVSDDDDDDSIGGGTGGEVVVGFCKWRRFEEGEGVGTELPEWPEGADAELCEETFGEWARRHGELMGGRGHWCAGSQLMRWGLERADQEGLEAYLEASPEAVRLYERFGFREAGRTETWIENERVRPGTWYRNLFMIRRAKGAG